jgi:polyhydroxybutyrate depolymerase
MQGFKALILSAALLFGVGAAHAQSADFNGGLTVDGRERTYLLHLPDAPLDQKLPLVIALHGGGGQGKGMDALTHFNQVADRTPFIVVYPDGIDKNWADGREATKPDKNGVDDVAFLSALIDKLVKEQNVDPARVYITGISNGGFMAARLGCDLADKVAAIAVVAATLPERYEPDCKPSRPISVLQINGTDDPLVPYNGGAVGILGGRGQAVSAEDAVQFWAKADGCDDKPTVTRLRNTVLLDGTNTQMTQYTGCQDDSEVMFYKVNNGGHTWPGGLQYLGERVIGRTSRDFDATEVIWDFFSRHPMQAS